MACPHLNQILAELWPRKMAASDRIWVILDAARDERVYAAIEATGFEKCCLYTGRVEPVLRRAAPHLVRLEYGKHFTQYLIDNGWGDHWGVFLEANIAMEELRFHLKRFLRVQDDKGRRLLFRFYDPRVLRLYLPTCNPEELRIFFGPISRFVMEDENPATLIGFAFETGKLREEKVPMALKKPAVAR